MIKLNQEIIDNGDGTYSCGAIRIKQDSYEKALFALEIIDNEDGTYTRGGVQIAQPNSEMALNTFSGQAPDGWIEPKKEENE